MSFNLDFLVIGSQRCATSYVHSIFEDETTTNVSKQKELNFFSHHIYTKDLSWYFSKFELKGRLTGEVCPSYFLMRPAEIKKVKELFPDLKVVLILRDPVKRMWSSIHRHWTYSYLEDTKNVGTDFQSLFQFIMTPTNLYFGKYSYAIEKWKKEFGKDQLQILFYEDIKENPKQFMSELYLFLDIAEEPVIREQHKNTSKVKGEVDKRINYLIYQTHKREIKNLIELGYQRAIEWDKKYKNSFKNQKIPTSLKITAFMANMVSQYVYDPINKVINWRRSYKLKKRRLN
jgi:hypothetical protein